MRYLSVRTLILAVALAAVTLCLAAQPASAAPEYGPWMPPPGEGGVYNAKLEPFNSEDVAEQTGFVCVDKQGRPIGSGDRDLLGRIVLAATDVFDGEFSFTGRAPGITSSNDRVPENGSYPNGAAGMRAFLSAEKNLLRSGRWTPYDNRYLVRADQVYGAPAYPSARSGFKIASGDRAPMTSAERGRRVASFLPSSASHPLQLTSELPEACALDPLEPEQPGIGDFLTGPGDFFLSQLLYGPAKLASDAFSFLQPYAFRYTFWTPHTERGDLLWTVPQSCTPMGRADRFFDRSQINDACRGKEPLGFSSSSAKDAAGKGNWFVAAANFLQWLVSGVYFLILFAAALAYIFSTRRHSQLNVIRLVPRILISILFTIGAPFLIGSLISTANVAVSALFSFDEAATVGALNTFLLQAGNIAGGGELIQQLTQLLVGSFTVFYFLVFVVASLLRQVLLVALVVLAPLAALMLVVPRWRNRFTLYVRTLLAVIFVPVAMAFTLKLGVTINPLVINPEGAYGSLAGVAGLILMVGTLYLMYKQLKLGRDYVLAAAGSVPAFAGISERLSGRSQKADTRDKQSDISGEGQDLVPAGRRPTAGGAPAAPLMGSRRSPGGVAVGLAGVLGPRSGSSRPGADSGGRPALGAGNGESSSSKKLLSFQSERSEGRKKLSAKQARAYREGLTDYIDAERERQGGKLSAEQLEKLKQEYAERTGGRLVHRGGSWYLEDKEPPQLESGNKSDS